MVLRLWTSELDRSDESKKRLYIELSYVGGSVSPFIDEGDSFTGERERVCLLLHLVAHADRHKTIVGARNTVYVTVECQMHVGGCVIFFGYGRRRHLQILLMPRGM